ncbi:MAG: response regulator transcription factor [Spirochaetales bacterium]|nr:response regulator transcription factor [Spirochaetales bacterium]
MEDNEAVRKSVENYLLLNDFSVTSCRSCEEVKSVYREEDFDLAILDVGLPDGNSFLLAKEVFTDKEIPFLFLTSYEEESNKITGLELGAADYVTKPFSLKELILRVKKILSRLDAAPRYSSETSRWTLKGETIEWEERSHRIRLNGETIHLTTMEWDIMRALINHRGCLLSRKQILSQLEHLSDDLNPRTVDSHIKNIRKKLKSTGWISTVHSLGFCFNGEKLA